MKELFALFGKISMVLWLVTLVRTFLYSLVVTGGALSLALEVKPWDARTEAEKWILALKLAGIQTGVMLAFLDSTIAKLSALATTQNNQKGNPS